MSGERGGLDLGAVSAAVDRQRRRVTPGIENMARYHAKQVFDESHREVLGPLLPASGASGVVRYGEAVITEWGDPLAPEMAYSVTKSVVSVVAGVAARMGVLGDVHEPVADSVDLSQFAEGPARRVTWEHLLQQTSQWEGELWGKPTSVDAQSRRPGTRAGTAEPGSGWAYNDVRVNLLCLALTELLGVSLPDLLGERVLGPLGGSRSWSWHGYSNSYTTVNGRRLPVVSGGAHWGGGLFMSAHDLALIGRLLVLRGRWHGRSLINEDWIVRSWRPCPVKPDYGYLWWLNRGQRVFPEAPATGVCARGNRSQHVLWIDTARDLVVAAHWSPGIGEFIGEISRCVPLRAPG